MEDELSYDLRWMLPKPFIATGSKCSLAVSDVRYGYWLYKGQEFRSEHE